MVDLWSGIGGLLTALMALGLRCVAVAAEQDHTLRLATHTHFPNLVSVSSVEELTGKDFREVLQRRSFTAVVIGGGSPCQGNSRLNASRRGWEDARSRQPLHLQRLLHELATELQTLRIDIPVFGLLENVATTPPEVISRYSSLMNNPPLEIDA